MFLGNKHFTVIVPYIKNEGTTVHSYNEKIVFSIEKNNMEINM